MKVSYYIYIKFQLRTGGEQTNKVTYIGEKGIAGALLKAEELMRTVYDIDEELLDEIKISVGVPIVED